MGAEEMCNECGKSVKKGSGNYVNRVIDFDTEKIRKENGKPYPKGCYMCAECDRYGK